MNAGLCGTCSKSLVGMRSNAVYCSRKCKNVAAETRRTRDDAARYRRERDHRIAYAKTYAERKPWIGQAIRVRRKQRFRMARTYRFTGRDWKRLCDRHDGRCFYCGEVKPLTMDHVIPLSRGGLHSLGNILPACLPCNSSKRTRFIIEVRAGRRAGRWSGSATQAV